MTKNKYIEPVKIEDQLEKIDVSKNSEKQETKFIPGIMKHLFMPVLWSGILPTFRCEKCGYCDPNRDEIILHVITHVPEGDRDVLLEKLLKE
jgi:hypothetical protein